MNLLTDKKIYLKSQKSLAMLVDLILTITKDEDYSESTVKHAKVHEYEKQIDQIVFKLYGLTQEEIKIIENNKVLGN